jgi:hypothetical protein
MSSHYGLRRPTGKHDPVRFASTVQSSSAAAVEAAAVTRADCAEARVGGRSRRVRDQASRQARQLRCACLHGVRHRD